MTKIVYNCNYGGFSLSRAAADWLKEHGHPEILEEFERRKEPNPYDKFAEDSRLAFNNFWGRDISRTDPLLVECIETLGEKANGGFADLAIREVPEGTRYRIDKYDGAETIVTQEEEKWRVA